MEKKDRYQLEDLLKQYAKQYGRENNHRDYRLYSDEILQAIVSHFWYRSNAIYGAKVTLLGLVTYLLIALTPYMNWLVDDNFTKWAIIIGSQLSFGVAVAVGLTTIVSLIVSVVKYRKFHSLKQRKD